jgi:thymidylate synthase (FAD)
LPSQWRIQSKNNKQGSDDFADESIGKVLSKKEENLHNMNKEIYQKRIEVGIAREQARKDLPLSTYTEAYWKIDLHNLFHFLKLRMDAHAQLEIRSYAKVIGEEIVSKWCPIAWEAFVDYRLNSEHFSEKELKVISFMQSNMNKNDTEKHLLDHGFYLKNDLSKPSRELQEFERKLRKHNFVIPWTSV